MDQKLLNAFADVILKMPAEFDSHDFIKKLMQDYPIIYAETIINYKNIPAAHGHIAIALSENSEVLEILLTGSTKSLNVYNESSECALWKNLK